MNKSQSNLNYKKGYGKNFANLRKKEYNGKEDYTVRGLAEKLKIASSTISLIEKEQRVPTIEQVNVYKDFFGVSLDYLVGDTNIIKADMKAICEYIHCGEDVIETIRSIYDEVNIYNEEEKDSYIRDINFLNNIFSSQLFKELIINIFWAECMSDTISKNPASILSTDGYTDFGALQIQKRVEQCLGIPDSGIISRYIFRMIINHSVEKNNKISSYAKNTFKSNFENFVQQANNCGLNCDVSRYNANKTLEKLLNEMDSREKIYKLNTREQWLNYLQITEQDVENIIKAVENAETSEELLKIGAISKEEYEDGAKIKKELDEEQKRFELEQKRLKDEIERLKEIISSNPQNPK